jgi:hypothetical protein
VSHKRIDLPLSNLANGAVQEKLDYELKKVFDNIHDPNTNAEDKRTVTLKLEFVPDENRQTVKLNSNISIKLANVKDTALTVLTDKNLADGKVEARELKSNVPGQTYFDDDSNQRTDVGDPVDVIEKEQKRKNIINLQKGRG